ncbi:UNVERIFIED_CONTAM: hypothetical protein GTU68_043864 [Idotea baltica]|nr:hypothetical protein [Idotea baltica]
MKEVVIASAARTPVGSFNGALSGVTADYLGEVAIRGALERAGVEGKDVDEVIMGQILTAGGGQNPARKAARNAGCGDETPAWGMNQLCGSGLRAVALGYQHIAMGDNDIMVCGGQESMSLAPHVMHLRNGVKMGDAKMLDTMLSDGLIDTFHGYHMGVTAENVAEKWQITRDVQDAFAAASQNKAEAAQKAGKFKDEIVPVTIKGRKGDTIVEQDEYIKEGVTAEQPRQVARSLQRKKTANCNRRNASGSNDGASGSRRESKEEAEKRGIKPLATIKKLGQHGPRSGKSMGAGQSRVRKKLR